MKKIFNFYNIFHFFFTIHISFFKFAHLHRKCSSILLHPDLFVHHPSDCLKKSKKKIEKGQKRQKEETLDQQEEEEEEEEEL